MCNNMQRIKRYRNVSSHLNLWRTAVADMARNILRVYEAPCLKSMANAISKFSLNTLPTKPGFLHVFKTPWEKEKLLVTSNFSFSPPCFLFVWRTFSHFHQTQNCRLQTLSVWKSLKVVVWERVNQIIQGLSGQVGGRHSIQDQTGRLHTDA